MGKQSLIRYDRALEMAVRILLHCHAGFVLRELVCRVNATDSIVKKDGCFTTSTLLRV